MARSLCAQRPGFCARDPQCDDRYCPGHPGVLNAADLAAGQRALHVEDGGTWITTGHRVLRLRPEQVRPTGREPDLLQDADRGLSKWLASKPYARLHAREAAAAHRRTRLNPFALFGAAAGLAAAAACVLALGLI